MSISRSVASPVARSVSAPIHDTTTPPASNLRSVSQFNVAGESNSTVTNVVGREDCLSHCLHRIGSGTVTKIILSFNNWSISADNGIDFPANAYKIKEAWLTHSGGVSVQVKVGGSGAFIIGIGENDTHSDPILPSDFSLSDFPEGTSFSLGVRWVPVNGGGATIVGGTVSQISKGTVVDMSTSKVATIAEDIFPSAKLQAYAGLTYHTGWGSGGTFLPIIMLGEFDGTEPPIFLGMGDSITAGVGDGNATGKPQSFFQRALQDDNDTPTVFRAGIRFARPSGNAKSFGQGILNDPLGMLNHWSKYCNILVERYGVNNRDYPSQYDAKAIVWDTFLSTPRDVGARSPVVVVCALSGQTTSTDSFATVVNQTLGSETNPTGALSKINDQCLADVGTLIDYYVESLGIRGNSDKTTNDYWRWAAATTSDGLHPNDTGHELIAGDLRTLYATLGWT